MPENLPSGADRTPPPNVGVIDKGWAVYDAEDRPMGTVCEVKPGGITVDGRPVGYGFFDILMTDVMRAGNNEVHCSIRIEEAIPAEPGLMSRTVTSVPMSSTAAITGVAPEGDRMQTSGAAATDERGSQPTPVRTVDSEGGRSWLPYIAGLALAGAGAGAGAGGYYWWRRRRQRSMLEKAVDLVADSAHDRSLRLWASLAAAMTLPVALPLAYYFWPSHSSTIEQARDQFRGDWTERLASMSRADWQDLLASLKRGDWQDRLSSVEQRAFIDAAGTYLSDMSGYLADEVPSRRWLLAIPAAAGFAALVWYLLGRGGNQHPSMRLSDIMTRDPSVVRPDSTVSEAATMMRRLNVGSLPVCDGVQLQGMVTDRDITVRAIADGRDPTTTRVWDVMSHDVAWASEDVAVEEAAQIMREHQIRRLPVVDRNQNLVGIVSLGDLAVDVGEDPMSGATLEAISEPSRPDR